MKIFQDSDIFQKIARCGIQATGHVVSMIIVAALLLTWVLTRPFFQSDDRITRGGK